MKIEYSRDFDCNLRYLEAKFDYGYLIIFLRYGSKILHKKSQVISTTNEGVTAIFPKIYILCILLCSYP